MEGSLPADQLRCYQYKQYHGLNFFIAVTSGNNCCQIAGKVGVVKNILRSRQEDKCSRIGNVIFEEFVNCEACFTDPINSKSLSVFFVCALGSKNCSSNKQC